MQAALIFLLKTLADLYLLTFLLRFLMQWVRASYHNPLAQFVLRVTSPLVVPARRLLPSVGGLDIPTLVVLIVLEILATLALLLLLGLSLPVAVVLVYALLRMIALALWFYTVALFIYVLLSWFGDRGGNPMSELLGDLVEPLLRPARRLLPPIGGLDLSALIVILLLQAALIALPLPGYLR
jgi:YggT family protein